MIFDHLPSYTQIEYAQPDVPALISLAAYIYLLSTTSTLSGYLTNAPLLGPILTGILLGPELSGLLPVSTQSTFISLGYIGLLLIIFEAGLTTSITHLFSPSNFLLSVLCALTGVLVPIALSFALFMGAWGMGALQAFSAGAALCSTSLGTTIALLSGEWRKRRVGSVLMSAALLDDIVGLVIAGIIAELGGSGGNRVGWQTIVRPILVSLAFGVGTPLLAWSMKKLIHCLITTRPGTLRLLCDMRMMLFVIMASLSGFVAASKYAGTSELFGAYLAGAFLAYVFGGLGSLGNDDNQSENDNKGKHSPQAVSPSLPFVEPSNPPHAAFMTHIEPILTPLLGPIFFASIGAALPIGSLFTTHTSTSDGGSTVSHRVVWRGIVYSLLMIFAKMVVGVWMAVWPEPREEEKGERDGEGVRKGKLISNGTGNGDCDGNINEEDEDTLRKVEHGEGPSASAAFTPPDKPRKPSKVDDSIATASLASFKANTPDENESHNGHHTPHYTTSSNEPTRLRASILLGLAMVARGEIALIVAQLGKPLLVGVVGDEEPFAIVIWAVLVSTLVGAVGVGIVLGMWERRDQKVRGG